MKCKVCGTKIKNTQYIGLGQFEKVCIKCACPIINSKLPQIREKYLKEVEKDKELMRNGEIINI